MKKSLPKNKKELSVNELLELHNKDMKRYVGSLSEEFQGRLDGVVEQFGGMNKRFDGIDNKLDSHSEMIGKIMIQLHEIKSDLEQKVSIKQFAQLEKRVVMLEAKSHK